MNDRLSRVDFCKRGITTSLLHRVGGADLEKENWVMCSGRIHYMTAMGADGHVIEAMYVIESSGESNDAKRSSDGLINY